MTHIKTESKQMIKNREISIQSIEQWRSQLPLSDLSASTRAFYITLKDIHSSSLSPETRLEILSLLQPTLGYLCITLQKYYHQSAVLSEHQRLIADLVYVLNIEMIHGYKLVVEAESKSFFPNKTILLAGLQKAMHFCTKILFSAFEQHYRPPKGIWLELNDLYAFAQNKNLNNKSFPKNIDWVSRFNCLADIYKHALLFAIANPHQLRHEESTKLLYAIESWAPLLNLRKINDKNEPLIIIDAHSDLGPKYAALTSMPLPTEHCLELDLDKVNEHLSKLLSAQRATRPSKSAKTFSTSELELPISYIESLSNAWRSVSERVDEREQTHGYITVYLGIAASHWFISQQQNVKNPPLPANPELEIPEDSIILDTNNLSQTKTPGQSYQAYHCELVDQSKGGYRLKWSKDIPAQLQTGEIISIIRSDEKATVAIGTIRWIIQEKDDTTLVGVQLLSTNALAVMARSSTTTTLQPVSTLLLPEQVEFSKPMTLITPTLPFKTGLEIEIYYDNQSYTASLQKRFSFSPSFQEFGLDFPFAALQFPTQKTAGLQIEAG